MWNARSAVHRRLRRRKGEGTRAIGKEGSKEAKRKPRGEGDCTGATINIQIGFAIHDRSIGSSGLGAAGIPFEVRSYRQEFAVKTMV